MWEKIIHHLDKIDALRRGEFIAPVVCEIDLSNMCQNRCSFCMYEDYLRGHRVFIDNKVYRETLEDLKEMGTKAVLFAGGGEPLTHPEFKFMAMAARDMDFEIGLLTNGIALHKIDGILDEFKFIRISLDAAMAKTYKAIKKTDVFDDVVENIKDAVRNSYKTTIGLNFVICNENRHEMEAARNIVAQLRQDCPGIAADRQRFIEVIGKLYDTA